MPDLKLVTNANGGWKDFTTQTSTLVRNLGLSALAITWLLAGGLGDDADSPQKTLHLLRCQEDLWPSFAFAIIALCLDVLHYVLGAFLYGVYSWTSATLVSHPRRDSTESDIAFVLALLFLIVRHIEDEASLPEMYGASRKSRLWDELDRRPRTTEVAEALEMPVVPWSVTVPPLIVFWAKAAALTTSYIFLATYIL